MTGDRTRRIVRGPTYIDVRARPRELVPTGLIRDMETGARTRRGGRGPCELVVVPGAMGVGRRTLAMYFFCMPTGYKRRHLRRSLMPTGCKRRHFRRSLMPTGCKRRHLRRSLMPTGCKRRHRRRSAMFICPPRVGSAHVVSGGAFTPALESQLRPGGAHTVIGP